MTDDFDFKLAGLGEEKEFVGYASNRDKTSVPAGTLVRGSKNVYKKPSGTIANRCGLKRRGEVDSTDAGVKSSYEWIDDLGNIRPVRVQSNLFQVEWDDGNGPVWYTLTGLERSSGNLLSGPTINPAADFDRFVFDTWYDDDEPKNELIMCRGDYSILFWAGGITKLQSVVSGIVATVSTNNPGTNYTSGDVLRLSGGSGATIRVTNVGGGGAISAIELISGGSGYTAGSVATTNDQVSNPAAAGATITITVAYGFVKQGTTTWREDGFLVRPSDPTASMKKIIVNGNVYSYTGGEDSDTLTLSTSATDPTLEPTDSIITSAVAIFADIDIADSNFKVDMIKVIGNQVFAGSYTSRAIYISSDTDFSDFTNSGDYVYGDPDFAILDSPCRGIGSKDGKAIAFGGDKDLYVITPNAVPPISFTVGSAVRYIITKVEKKPLPNLNAAQAHEFIGNFNDLLVWLDQNNQLRAFGSFNFINEIKPTLLSFPVFDELREEDFTGGHLKPIVNTIHLTAPNSGRDWEYEIRENVDTTGNVTAERIWHPPQIRSLSRFAVIDGLVYGHSAINPQIYQVEDTGQWYDDSPSEEQISYNCIARFPYLHHTRRQGRISFDKVYLEGYMVLGSEVNLNIYFDYGGQSNNGRDGVVQSHVVNSVDFPALFFDPLNRPTLGGSSLGLNPLGEGLVPDPTEQQLLPKFRAIADCEQVNCFEYSLELTSNLAGTRWELVSIGANPDLSSEQAVFIRKSAII